MNKIWNYRLVVLMIAAFLTLSGCGNNQPAGAEPDGILIAEADSGKTGSECSETGTDSGNQEKEQETEKIYVQVEGAVVNPGVYTLKQGSRVFEAVELAGGITEEADSRSVNQAELLADGQMIYIMTKEETAEQIQISSETEDGKVNLNTASAEQLMTLPGIGQSKAESILNWREENGGFTRIEDLMQIEGIKEGVFSRIKDHVKVN